MIVLDASALVDVVLDQPTAGWVLDEIAEEEVCAPAHQPAEVLSALARLVRAAQVDVESARAALDEALALPQLFVSATAGHVRLAFALRDRIRVVDGLYVALADELACPLVTTDRRLAVADAPCEIHTPPTQPGRSTDVPAPRPTAR
ncbi:MAG TPA: type II toxin-antitoxin system VapC family toxin [Pseudonocardiaceae bacterium]